MTTFTAPKWMHIPRLDMSEIRSLQTRETYGTAGYPVLLQL